MIRRVDVRPPHSRKVWEYQSTVADYDAWVSEAAADRLLKQFIWMIPAPAGTELVYTLERIQENILVRLWALVAPFPN